MAKYLTHRLGSLARDKTKFPNEFDRLIADTEASMAALAVLLRDQSDKAVGALSLMAGLVLWLRRKDYRTKQAEYDGRSLDDKG